MPSIRELRKRLYEAYQLDWMMSHHHSVNDLVAECESLASDYAVDYAKYCVDGGEVPEENTTCELDFEESGFGGELYVCEDEFLSSEYLDTSYMIDLIGRIGLTGEERYAYTKAYLNDALAANTKEARL